MYFNFNLSDLNRKFNSNQNGVYISYNENLSSYAKIRYNTHIYTTMRIFYF